MRPGYLARRGDHFNDLTTTADLVRVVFGSAANSENFGGISLNCGWKWVARIVPGGSERMANRMVQRPNRPPRRHRAGGLRTMTQNHNNQYVSPCSPVRSLRISVWLVAVLAFGITTAGLTGTYFKGKVVMSTKKSDIEFLVIEGGVLQCQELNPTDKFVYSYLAFRQRDHEYAYPGQPLIAKDLGIGVRTAHDSTQRLEKIGLLEATRTKGGRNRSNHYRLVPFTEWLATQNHAESARLEDAETMQNPHG